MGPCAFLACGNFGVPRYESKYESTQPFVWEGTNQLLQGALSIFAIKIYFKHGLLAFWGMPLGIFGGPERTEGSCF